MFGITTDHNKIYSGGIITLENLKDRWMKGSWKDTNFHNTEVLKELIASNFSDENVIQFIKDFGIEVDSAFWSGMFAQPTELKSMLESNRPGLFEKIYAEEVKLEGAELSPSVQKELMSIIVDEEKSDSEVLALMAAKNISWNNAFFEQTLVQSQVVIYRPHLYNKHINQHEKLWSLNFEVRDAAGNQGIVVSLAKNKALSDEEVINFLAKQRIRWEGGFFKNQSHVQAVFYLFRPEIFSNCIQPKLDIDAEKDSFQRWVNYVKEKEKKQSSDTVDFAGKILLPNCI